MTEAELASDSGHERLSACVFRVPVGSEMVSRTGARGMQATTCARHAIVITHSTPS